LSNEELGKIRKSYCDSEQDLLAALTGKDAAKEADNDKGAFFLRYVEFSMNLSMHKDSFNLMKSHMV